LQSHHISGPIKTKPEVGADNYQLGSQRAQQDLVNELGGMHLTNLPERKNTDQIDTERLQDLQAMVDGGQQSGNPLGSYQRQRMRIEGQYRSLAHSNCPGAHR
jgi:hypothetical protein